MGILNHSLGGLAAWRLGCVVTVLSLPAARANAAGSLDAAVQIATTSLGPTPRSSVVVAAPLASDQPVLKADELALRVAVLVAGKTGGGARVHPQTAQLSTARAIAGRASALVYVQTDISRGDIGLTVDVYPSMANTWDRIRNPLPAPSGHAFGSAKVDAEVRAFLAPLLLEQATVHRARHDEGEVLAAACGDVDGDGGNELLLVSRARVSLGRVREGKFVAERTALWNALAPRLPVPIREPIAGAVVSAGTVAVGLTDRGWLSLTADFAGRTSLFGMPAWGGEGLVCLIPEPSAGAFDGAPVGCALSRDVKPKMAVPAPRFDAFAAARISDPAGVGSHTIVAVREPSGKLRLKMDDVQRAPDTIVGPQLAVGDLDQDGAPELVASSDGPDEAITISTWSSPGTDPRVRLRIPAPAGVRALAICPPEEHSTPVLVAVVGSELLLVRAETQRSAQPDLAKPASRP